jgi:hypothetical protein
MIHGISITATAFNGGNLFAKNSDPDETGMGLAGDPSGEHEIFANMGGTQTISSLIRWVSYRGLHQRQVPDSSTGGGDQWQVTACSTAGVSGSGPCSVNASTLVGGDGTCNLAPMNLTATNLYLDICPTKGNVLLDELQPFDPPT